MPKPLRDKLAPDSVGVKTIPTESLVPNPHNPRMLFDRGPLKVLEDSIAKVGILVPLTVYWSDGEDRFVILDGQRRWMCAQALGIRNVPVNQVAEPSVVQNIVTMFQIHKFREDWELMPTALKLEVLMRELNDRNDKRLAVLTGLDRAVVIRCKKLLSYPKKYQDLMLDEDPQSRIKADFFIELYPVVNDKFVQSLKWFSRDNFIKRMLLKYVSRTGALKAVTDFRIMKQHITNARHSGNTALISRRLKEFVHDDSLPLAHLAIASASVAASARKVLLAITKLTDTLHALDAQEFYGEEALWKSLEGLVRLIRSKLLEAGRRLRE